MWILLFMIAVVFGFKFFPKLTGGILTLYAIVMIIASFLETSWAWWPFHN